MWGIKKATAFLARHSPGYLAQCEWKAVSSCAAKLCCVPAQHGSRSFVPALRFRRLSAHRAAFPASPRSAGRRVARSRSIPSMRVVRRRWRPHGPPATSPVRVRVRVRVVRVRVSFPAEGVWLAHLSNDQQHQSLLQVPSGERANHELEQRLSRQNHALDCDRVVDAEQKMSQRTGRGQWGGDGGGLVGGGRGWWEGLESLDERSLPARRSPSSRARLPIDQRTTALAVVARALKQSSEPVVPCDILPQTANLLRLRAVVHLGGA